METGSTRSAIQNEALAVFARKGYEGATMNDIAGGVGINKASIYNHFTSKADIFYAVYQELAGEYEELTRRIIKDSEEMPVPDRLAFIFRESIVFYYRNPEKQAFWNQITLFTPGEIRQKFWGDIMQREQWFEVQMEEIFAEGMKQGLIRQDDPARMMMSFRALKEGLLNWMLALPETCESWPELIWKHLWEGLQVKRD